MPEYTIVFARSARKELQALPQRRAVRILEAVEALATEPRPRGCRKLIAADELWRFRSGDYRVLYKIDDSRRLVDVIAVRHRKDAYQ